MKRLIAALGLWLAASLPALANVDIQEVKTPAGFTLEVTGTGGLGDGPTNGTITIVREDGKLKIDKESWKS